MKTEDLILMSFSNNLKTGEELQNFLKSIQKRESKRCLKQS